MDDVKVGDVVVYRDDYAGYLAGEFVSKTPKRFKVSGTWGDGWANTIHAGSFVLVSALDLKATKEALRNSQDIRDQARRQIDQQHLDRIMKLAKEGKADADQI